MVVRQKGAVLSYHRIGCYEPARLSDVSLEAFEEQMMALCTKVRSVEDGWMILDNGLSLRVTFDDGTKDQWIAAEVLAKLGMTATFFIITSRIGQDGYLAPEQIRQLCSTGHAIGSHTVSHRKLPFLPPNEVLRELVVSRNALRELTKQAVDWLAVPGGYYSQWCFEAARIAEYKVVRTMERGYVVVPAEGRTACIPVLRSCTGGAFERVLSGEATFLGYRALGGVRRILGESAYLRARSWIAW